MEKSRLAGKGMSAFIDLLEQNHELLRVKSHVSPDQEIAEIADRVMKQPEGGKALLFENNGTKFPLLINAFGSDKRVERIFEPGSPDRVFPEIFGIAEKLQSGGGLLKMIRNLWPHRNYLKAFPKHSKKRGACQDIVNTTPSLSELPVLTSWPFDGGPFITLPMVFTRHPETGVRNIGMYRMQVFDDKTTGMHWHRHKGGAEHYRAWKQKGGKMPVAVVLGGDPLYTYMASAPLPENMDELLFCGLIRKQAVKLVQCISQDIEVPADADIVLEGYIDTEAPLRTEGPFGDHTGFYSLEDAYPVFHLTAITHRKNAVYPATIVGIPPMEDFYLGKTTEKLFKPAIKTAIAPELLDFHLPGEGVAHNLVLLKVNNKYPGVVSKTMHALLGAGQMMFSKVLLALPESMELTNYDAVLRHVAAGIHPDKVIVSSGPADELEHASPEPVFGGKLLLDLSAPVETDDIMTHFEKRVWRYGNILLRYRKPGESENADPVADGISCIVDVDFPLERDAVSLLLWWILANTDPKRDVQRRGDVLHVDARVKAGMTSATRPWPQPVVASDAVIEAIDSRWDTFGIGRFIPSPSKNIKRFVKSDAAAMKID
ncbi:MAG: menaquinone biosynthesis decarboxylase [Bacteroidota bacterium]